MAVYTVDGPGGQVYTVEGPPDATDAQVIAAVKRQIEAEQRSASLRQPAGIMENILSGVGSGAVGLGEMAATGAASLLDDETELAARDKIRQAADYLRPEGGDQDALSYKLAQGVGSILGFAPTMLMGPAALPGALGLAVGAGAGEARDRAFEAEASPEERATATAQGALVGTLEVLPLTRMFKALRIKLPKGVEKALAPKQTEGIRQWVLERAKTGGYEGAQEAAANVLQNLTERGYRPEQETFDGTVEEGLIGAGAGAIVDALIPGRARGTREPEPEPAPDDVPPNEPRNLQADQIAEQRARAASARQLARELGEEQTDAFPDEMRAALEGDEAAPVTPEPEIGEAQIAQLAREAEAAEAEPPRQFTVQQEARKNREADRRIAAQQAADDAELAQLEAEEAQAQQERQALEARSSQETLDARRVDEQQRATEQGRREVLDRVLEAGEVGSANQVRQRFESALAEAGYSNTTPTESELSTLTRAANVAKAKPVARETLPEDPDAAHNEAMEAAIPEKKAPSKVQVVSDKILDGLGIPARAAVRNRVRGADMANTEQRNRALAELDAFAGNRNLKVPDGVQQNVADFSAKVKADYEAKPDITPAPMSETPVESDTQPAAEVEDVQPAQVKSRDDDGGAEAGVPDDQRPVNDRAGRPAQRAAAVERDGLADRERDVAAPAVPETAQPPALKDKIEAAASEAAHSPKNDLPEPTEAQKEAGNYKKGKARVAGLEVSIENPKGSVRTGTDANGKKWKRKIKSHYGYINRTEGADGDHVDVFIGPEPEADRVFVVDQFKPDGTFDEHKSLIGWDTKEAAKKGYAENYPKGWKVGPITEMSIDDFKAWVKTSKAKRPAAAPAGAEQKVAARDKATAKFKAAVKSNVGSSYEYRNLHAQDPSTAFDLLQLADLLTRVFTGRKSKGKISDAESAQAYFSRRARPIDALEDIYYDLAFGVPAYKAMGAQELGDMSLQGTGGANAVRALKWVRDNLSATMRKEARAIAKRQRQFAAKVHEQDAARAAMDDFIAPQSTAAPTQVRERLDRNMQPGAVVDIMVNGELVDPDAAIASAERATDESLTRGTDDVIGEFGTEPYLDDLSDLPFNLKESATAASFGHAHPAAVTALQRGDLRGALQLITDTSSNFQLRRLAGKLAKALGDTKVVIQKGLKDDAGNAVAGQFDPKTNTVTLAAGDGILNHTVLHEVTHALVSNTLRNKSHPVTRQLSQLYEQMKDRVATHYGAENLQEFVAEAFSNPQFRAELSANILPDTNATAWRKFANTVGNFLRRLLGLPVKSELSLSRVDTLIESILAPAPDSVNAGALYMMASTGRVGELVEGVGKLWNPKQRALVPREKASFLDKTVDMLKSKLPSRAKQGVLYFLPSQPLMDVAEHNGFLGVQEIHKLIERQEGAINEVNAELDQTAKDIESAYWGKEGLARKKRFDDVVHKSTLWEVDPTLSLEKARDKYDFASEKFEDYKAIRALWDALDPASKANYVKLRDSYRKLFERLKDSIFQKIDDAIDDPKIRQGLKEDVYARLFSQANIDPYFPLVRRGDYWLQYSARVDGRLEPVIEAFETKDDREAAMTRLSEESGVIASSITPFMQSDKRWYDKAPPTSMVGETLKLLESAEFKTGQDKSETINELMQLFVSAMPESSFAKSLHRRKGTPGYMNDAMQAFHMKAYSIASQTQRMKYSSMLRSQLQTVQDGSKEWYQESQGLLNKKRLGKLTEADQERLDHRKPMENDDTYRLILDEIGRRVEFATNPPTDFWARRVRDANRIAFLGTIGFNLSSAIVNLSQVPLVAVPTLAAKTDMGTVMTALRSATAFYAQSGSTHRVRKFARADGEAEFSEAKGYAPSIDNFYEMGEDGQLRLRTDKALDNTKKLANGMTQKQFAEELRPLIQMARERGLLNRSMFYDTLGLESGGKGHNYWDTISAWSAAPFHTAERFNRQVTLIASYLNEKARMERTPTAEERGLSAQERQTRAVENALYETQQVNGGAVLGTAPGIAQKGIGRVAMMYKGFGIQMYYHQLKTAHTALKDADPEIRKVAMRQIVGIQLSALLMSGVQGITLFGIGAGIANLFLDDDEEDAETIVRQYIGEGPYKGLFTHLTGVDVGSRIGLSNLILQSNRYEFDPSMEKSIVKTLGGPFYGYASQAVRGVTDIANGELQRGVENIMPAAFRNIAKSIRVAQEGGYKTRRHDPIYDDVPAHLIAAQAMGFAPAEYTRRQEANQIIKKIDRKAGEDRTALLRKHYIALRLGDTDGLREAMDEIRKYNAKFPTNAIDAATVQRSVKSHMDTSASMYNGIAINPRLRAALQGIGDDYQEGFEALGL